MRRFYWTKPSTVGTPVDRTGDDSLCGKKYSTCRFRSYDLKVMSLALWTSELMRYRKGPARIELATQRFAVFCSTDELRTLSEATPAWFEHARHKAADFKSALVTTWVRCLAFLVYRWNITLIWIYISEILTVIFPFWFQNIWVLSFWLVYGSKYPQKIRTNIFYFGFLRFVLHQFIQPGST